MSEPKIIELDMKAITKMNLWLTFLLCVLFFVGNSYLHQQSSFSFTFLDIFLFIVYYFALIVLHEIFHLIGFMIFGKVQFKQLDYGVNLKLGIAYATTSVPLKNNEMKKALLLPFWTTGVIPTLIGFYFNSSMFVLLGAILIAGAVGDFYMYKELRKFPKDALIKDDPKLPRLYVYND